MENNFIYAKKVKATISRSLPQHFLIAIKIQKMQSSSLTLLNDVDFKTNKHLFHLKTNLITENTGSIFLNTQLLITQSDNEINIHKNNCSACLRSNSLPPSTQQWHIRFFVYLFLSRKFFFALIWRCRSSFFLFVFVCVGCICDCVYLEASTFYLVLRNLLLVLRFLVRWRLFFSYVCIAMWNVFRTFLRIKADDKTRRSTSMHKNTATFDELVDVSKKKTSF